MVEILTAVKKYDDKAKAYAERRINIAESLEKHAYQLDGERRHILHGWGDKGAYNVGSLCDTDGQMRFGANAFSFWCICHMIDRDLSFKKDILYAYDKLDSKYGFKTFDKHFPKGMEGIGRITNLTPGTHENGATYIHGTMFAIMALFIIGEGERAWEQIFKTLPITHKTVTKSPFVMPNCYYSNEDYKLDGQSAGDWYTGSGAVLMRCIIEHAMGFLAYPEGLKVAPPNYMPSDEITMKIFLKNSNVTFKYTNKNSGTREYFVNGVKCEKLYDEVSASEYIWLKNEEISGDTLIEVID
jgi:cellobiose phosphorylase